MRDVIYGGRLITLVFNCDCYQVSFYDNGNRVGPAWEFKIGGGVLVGHVDDKGDLTGDDMVYTYPDFTTLLVGKFRRSVMISSKLTTLSGIRSQSNVSKR